MLISVEELIASIVDLCIKIHRRIGPGCFEKLYKEILYYELIKLGYKVERQLLLPIDYEDLHIEKAYKLNLFIEDMLVLELKYVYPLPLFTSNKLEHNFLY